MPASRCRPWLGQPPIWATRRRQPRGAPAAREGPASCVHLFTSLAGLLCQACLGRPLQTGTVPGVRGPALAGRGRRGTLRGDTELTPALDLQASSLGRTLTGGARRPTTCFAATSCSTPATSGSTAHPPPEPVRAWPDDPTPLLRLIRPPSSPSSPATDLSAPPPRPLKPGEPSCVNGVRLTGRDRRAARTAPPSCCAPHPGRPAEKAAMWRRTHTTSTTHPARLLWTIVKGRSARPGPATPEVHGEPAPAGNRATNSRSH